MNISLHFIKIQISILHTKTIRFQNQLIVLLLICSPIYGIAQSKQIDSLKALLETSEMSVYEEGDLQLKIASKHNLIRDKNALPYIERAQKLFEQTDSIDMQYTALLELANYNRNYGDIEVSKKQYFKVKEYAEKNNNRALLMRSNGSLTGYYMMTNRLEDALSLGIENKEMAVTDIEHFHSLMGMANLYQAKRDFKAICQYASMAFEYAIKLKSKIKEAQVLARLGKCHLYQREYDIALSYLEQTIEIAEKEDFKNLAAYTYTDIAKIYADEKKDSIKSIAYIKKAYSYAKELDNPRLLQGLSIRVATQLIVSGEQNEGVSILKKAYKDALKSNNIDYATQIARSLEVMYTEHIKNKDSIIYWSNTFNRLKDSIFDIKKEKSFKEIETKYKVEETEEANVELQAALEEKRKEQLKLLISGVIVIGILLLIGVLIFKNLKRKQKILAQERLLEKQNIERLLKDQELATIDAIIIGQEKERRRIASELHDNIGANLAAAKLQFKHITNNRDRIEDLESLFNTTETLLDETYEEVRALAHQKNNGVLAKDGLLPAVERLTKNTTFSDTLKVELTDFGLDERLDNTFEITIFRILQELVTNIIKHADATEANISITKHEGFINIIVEDNGKGFSTNLIQNKRGMGLSSIDERVRHLDGSLEVESSPGHGTNILIDIPLKKAV